MDVGNKTSGGVTIVNLNISHDPTAMQQSLASKASGILVNSSMANAHPQHSTIISADPVTSTTTVSVASNHATHATTGRMHKSKQSRSSPSSPKDPYRRTITTGNIKIRKSPLRENIDIYRVIHNHIHFYTFSFSIKYSCPQQPTSNLFSTSHHNNSATYPATHRLYATR